jgi:hypothetical protein
MAIDPSIALGYRGIEAPNPLNQFAQVQQLQANEMKMQEAMAANQERNALRRLDPAAADYENQLFKVNPQLGIQFRKERTASEASQAMAAQHKAEAAAKRATFAAQGERDLARNPSNANITAWLEDTQASDLFTAQEKAAAAKQAEAYLSMPVEKRAAAMQMRGATASDYTSRANNAATVAATMRGQDLTDARAKDRGDLKPVPVHAQKAITGAASTIAQLDKAIAELKANPDAVGLKGLTPDIALNRLDPEGTTARASLSDIGSLKIHDRSGAAVTAAETPRLKPFIPSISDDYETALKKLERMRDVQAAEQEVLTGTYNKDQGFRDFSAPQPTGATPAAPARPATPAAPAAASNVVALPNGSSMTFPDAKSAAAFKKKAGL